MQKDADEIALKKIVLQDGYYAEIIEEPHCMKLLDGAVIPKTNGDLNVAKLSLSEIAQAKNDPNTNG
ncbi:MAG: hypothetical protein CNLJKLNK_01111 [Holosporales bacterium]